MIGIKPAVGGRAELIRFCGGCGVEGAHWCPACLRKRLAERLRRNRVGRVPGVKGAAWLREGGGTKP